MADTRESSGQGDQGGNAGSSTGRPRKTSLCVSKAELLEAQQMARMGNWWWDVQTGEVVWSEEVYRIFGLDPAEFTPQIDSILERSPWPEDHARAETLCRQAAESHESGTYEQRFLRPDGSVGWYSSTFRGVYDDHDDLVAMKGIVQDITDRKRAVADLLRLSTAIEQAIDGIVVVDPEGKIQFANGAWARMHGYDQAEILGQSLAIFHDRDHRGLEIAPGMAQMKARNAGTFEGEVFHVRSDGTRFETWMSASIVRDERGEPIGYVAMARDITEKKLREAQLRQAQKMEAIGRLAAGVAHDFNNQLQVVIGFCEMLQLEVSDRPNLTEMVSQIHKAADRARSTTSHLLAFSRKQVLEPQVVDVRSFLRDVERPIGRMIGEDIELAVSADSDIPPVYVDKAGLHQAIMNLAVNARDAMPQGGRLEVCAATATIGLEQAAEFSESVPGQYVMLEVRDSGTGMSQDTMTRLFEPFFTTKEQGKGTGLGMPMVQGFVRQSNGYLHVNSEPGRGTDVRILLPPAKEDVEDRKERVLTPAVSSDGAANQTILVVEDEHAVRKLLVGLLEKAGYGVLAAATPSAAIGIATDMRPDLVVSDVIMPEMRGDELAERLKEICGPWLPFVFVSGYADAKISGHEILRKPYKSDKILAAIRRELHRAHRASGRVRRQSL